MIITTKVKPNVRMDIIQYCFEQFCYCFGPYCYIFIAFINNTLIIKYIYFKSVWWDNEIFYVYLFEILARWDILSFDESHIIYEKPLKNARPTFNFIIVFAKPRGRGDWNLLTIYLSYFATSVYIFLEIGGEMVTCMNIIHTETYWYRDRHTDIYTQTSSAL